MRYLITGGCGFIGSNFIHQVLYEDPQAEIVNIDNLTYAGNLENVRFVEDNKQYKFVKCDINDQIEDYVDGKFDVVINFAAESHVDNSIADPNVFVRTNVLGAYNMLEFARKQNCRFVQVSTDEVYGSLDKGHASEGYALNPSSPYSASKAAADLLVLGNYKTYNQDVIITRCTNNYGINQHPEKLLPKIITLALQNRPIPIYGDGTNIREWIHVADHCRGILAALKKGRSGEIYNFGSSHYITNNEIVKIIFDNLPESTSAIWYVTDRKAHDYRYAVSWSKAYTHLGWRPTMNIFDTIPDLIGYYKRNYQT